MRKFLLAGAAIALAGSMARAQNAPGAPSEQPGQSSERGRMMMRGMMGDEDEMSGRERGERRTPFALSGLPALPRVPPVVSSATLLRLGSAEK